MNLSVHISLRVSAFMSFGVYTQRSFLNYRLLLSWSNGKSRISQTLEDTPFLAFLSYMEPSLPSGAGASSAVGSSFTWREPSSLPATP